MKYLLIYKRMIMVVPSRQQHYQVHTMKAYP